MPQVSIIVLNHNYPHNIQRMLPSLQMTTGIDYETVVVDNGSTPDVVDIVKNLHLQGMIDTLVLEPDNNYFSEGNNIGVRASDPSTEFILLLNSDVEILKPDWLERMVEWAQGIPEKFYPYAWSTHPTVPSNVQRGIVSIDWVRNFDVPGCISPDGWCCLIRREAWREIDPDFPMAYGIVKMLASIVRDGYPCGCLCQFGKFIKHYSQGSSTPGVKITPKATPQVKKWWEGLSCEGLDFTYGDHQLESFMGWSRDIEKEFVNARERPSDMNEHMDVLHELAKECSHVVEAGVRYVVSSWAWIWGCVCEGGEVHSYCWTKIPEIERAIKICNDEGIPWHFHEGDWLQQEIPETDLLFIDTNHFYSQLKEELKKHSEKARKYIVLHDTAHFAKMGADGKQPGLWQAVKEFIDQGTWQIKEHYSNCHGLTILERVSE